MKTLEKIWDWLVYSSADPEKVSLMVKGFLGAAITGVISLLGFTHMNIPGVADQFNSLADNFVLILQAILGLISLLSIFFGGIRKLYLTIFGQ